MSRPTIQSEKWDMKGGSKMLAKLKARLNLNALRAFDTNRTKQYSNLSPNDQRILGKLTEHPFYNDALGESNQYLTNLWLKGAVTGGDALATNEVLKRRDLEDFSYGEMIATA